MARILQLQGRFPRLCLMQVHGFVAHLFTEHQASSHNTGFFVTVASNLSHPSP